MFSLHPQLEKDCFTIAESELSLLLLMNDRNYPWCILVPKRGGIKEIFQLAINEQHQLMDESSLLSETLMDSCQAHKINVAALGNMVPQLHIHHIARFENDPSWPKPIWGQLSPLAYEETEKLALISKLRNSPLDQVFQFKI